MDSIGPYKIERRVAEGGLSTVYEALDPRSGRRVAVKVARTTADSPDHALVVERFRRESSLLAGVKHSSIVSVSDSGVLPDGSPYVVSDWVEGRNLDQVLRDNGRLSVPIALSIAEQVAGALGAAHSHGFIHSDVKPANVLIQGQNFSAPLAVKLLDFGVAGELNTKTQMTTAGMLMGTPYYMSPEQIRAGALSPSSDIWALGVVLFEMLTGSLPFARREAFAVMSAIIADEIKIPPEANLPPPVAAFLIRCLAKDSKLRPADGNVAAEEIHRLRTRLPLATDTPTGEILLPSARPAPAPAVGTGLTTGVLPAGETRNSGSLLWFVAAATLLLLSGSLFVFLRYAHLSPGPWIGVALGVLVALGGVLLGRAIQKLLAARHSAITADVQSVLTGARSQRHLSQTLAIQVDELVSRCRLVDEKILAMTMAVMVEEFTAAKAFDDRQKALMNAVVLLEKLMPKLSPWYVRHDKLVGFAVTLVGLLSGLTTVVQNLVKLIKG